MGGTAKLYGRHAEGAPAEGCEEGPPRGGGATRAWARSSGRWVRIDRAADAATRERRPSPPAFGLPPSQRPGWRRWRRRSTMGRGLAALRRDRAGSRWEFWSQLYPRVGNSWQGKGPKARKSS